MFLMLEQKEEELLEHTYEVEKENNKMLRKLYHDMWWGRISRFIYWSLILAAMFGAYYYVQPYVGSMMETYQTASKLINGIGSFGK